MADLRLDYQVLEFTHATLSRLASQFDGMQTRQAQYDRAVGRCGRNGQGWTPR
jgi:hypothetical protein